MTAERLAEAKRLYENCVYMDLTPEQEVLVVEYESMLFKPEIDRMKADGQSLASIVEDIHGRWCDYGMADETETILLSYAEELFAPAIRRSDSLEETLAEASARSAEVSGDATRESPVIDKD